MLKYILKRIGFMLITLFIIMTLTFLLLKSIPVAPATTEVGRYHQKLMGIGRPILEQYWIFLKNVFTKWQWGYSFKIESGSPVWEVILKRLPPTFILSIYSIVFSTPIGMALGIYAAMKKNKWQDHTISTGVMLFISVPSFIYSFLVLYLLCFKADLFPMQIYSLDTAGSWWSPLMLFSMIPPIISYSFGSIAGWTRSVRAELTEQMTSDYVLLARTKGLTRGQAIRSHAFKNAMVPLFPGFIAMFFGVFSGSMIIENIFGIPGMGDLSLSAMLQLDYDIFMAVSMFYLFIGLAGGILVDISRGFLDPRIRIGAKKGGSY